MSRTLGKIEDRKEACKTYIEQTKLLVALSSAFVVAPAAVSVFIKMNSLSMFVISELCFILSVLIGYFVLATIVGSQEMGKYDVYRLATRIASLLQLFFYVVGLIVFIIIITQAQKLTG